ncbi:ABC transporter permease [uncultured Alsobacter sp.]|uniref:ABC transporter permease n=1 Tax=uncultured Alsobacter sp. TaxID=1748258 RepID=UPI0025F5DB3D|nr:ABC transporter permease [uncultured Alsobacter sp.]
MSAVAAPAPSTTRRPRRWRTLRRFVRHPGAFAAAVVLATIVILAIVAPWIVPYDWNETDLGARLGAPNAEFWFGTDLHGRDVFSRVVYGARYSISIGLATVTLSLLAGSFIGIVIGYAGGRIDEWGSRFIDVMLGFPQIVMAILVVSILGVGLVNVVLAVAIAGVPRFARVVRGAVLVVKEQPFIEAARALGAGDLRIMLRHLLPNAVPTLVVLGTLDLGNAILTTATLSFLGLGAQPPTPEWGAMLNSGREYMRYAPWTMMFPGFALFLVVMAVNLLGDRLSQVLDPRSVDRK